MHEVRRALSDCLMSIDSICIDFICIEFVVYTHERCFKLLGDHEDEFLFSSCKLSQLV